MDFDWGRAIGHGEQLAQEQVRRGDPVDERAIMWALLREAAETSRAYSGPPWTGWPSKSTMPDSPDEITVWQKVAAYLRGEIEDMPSDETRPPMPTASAVTRSEHVLGVWHAKALAHMGAWSERRKAVYLAACGCPVRKVTAITGMKPQQIHHARRQAMDDMWDHIKGLTNSPNYGTKFAIIEG